MFDSFQPIGRGPYHKKQKDGSTRHTSQLSADRAIDFINNRNDEKPFCLSVSFNAPHAEDGDKVDHFPWPKAIDGMYDDVEVAPPLLSDPTIYDRHPEFLKKSFNRVRYHWRWDSPSQWQKNIKGYYRMISGVDLAMGRVIDHLKARGIADNTVIVFAGDNGYYLGQRGFAGKCSHYEESLRVPLIILDPRDQQHRGQTLDQMVLNVDIAPTILSYAGVNTPSHYQGHALDRLVAGDASSVHREDFFCEHLFHLPVSLPKWEGVRGSRFVYARYFEQEPVYEYLHDLEADPKQLTNSAGDARYADKLERMRERCNQLRDQYGGRYSLDKFPLAR